MELENYSDLSTHGASPGFQFEFHCSNCAKTWRSPFKPYRKGQAAGFFGNLMMYVSGARHVGIASRIASDAGLTGAKKAALTEARQTADTLYTVCAKCQAPACGDCFSVRDGLCQGCIDKADGQRPASAAAAAPAAAAAGPAMSCPNCRAAHAGGRFCAECGFDMASTHKSCPDCGAMALRQARFCNDCGHGF